MSSIDETITLLTWCSATYSAPRDHFRRAVCTIRHHSFLRTIVSDGVLKRCPRPWGSSSTYFTSPWPWPWPCARRSSKHIATSEAEPGCQYNLVLCGIVL